jgi:hypothetical protein
MSRSNPNPKDRENPGRRLVLAERMNDSIADLFTRLDCESLSLDEAEEIADRICKRAQLIASLVSDERGRWVGRI